MPELAMPIYRVVDAVAGRPPESERKFHWKW
jgi:hypothetical protein